MNTLRKLLVVDDDPVVGKSFDRVLSGRGYAVVTASDGPEALRKMAAEEYDMVYTDIRMPGMDGIEVASEIKKHQPWLPVVIVSGYATPENVSRAKAAGVTAVLHKPLTPAMIEESARLALRERDALAAPPPVQDAVQAAPKTGKMTATEVPKRIGMLFAAPMLGLAFVLVLPFAAVAMMVGLPLWYGAKALARNAGALKTWAKNVALFVAAPFVGLAYVIAMPFVMVGMLAWMGIKALRERAHTA